MTTQELHASRSHTSWNWQHEWFMVLSANEWVLGRADGEAAIPAEYAVRLLVDHFGAVKLKALVDRAVVRGKGEGAVAAS